MSKASMRCGGERQAEDPGQPLDRDCLVAARPPEPHPVALAGVDLGQRDPVGRRAPLRDADRHLRAAALAPGSPREGAPRRSRPGGALPTEGTGWRRRTAAGTPRGRRRARSPGTSRRRSRGGPGGRRRAPRGRTTATSWPDSKKPKTSTFSPRSDWTTWRSATSRTVRSASRYAAAISKFSSSEAACIFRVEPRIELLVAALQEEDDVGDGLVVRLPRRQAGDAGTEAGVQVVVEAGPRQLAVDLDRAGPDLEVPRDHPHDPPRQAAPERPEVGVAVLLDPPRHEGPRPRLPRRDLDVGIGLVVAEADVVPGPVLLDEGVLEEQGLELGVRDDRFDLAVGPQQRLGLGALGPRPEVRGDALLERPGLSDVEKLSLVPAEEVDAGRIGQILRRRGASTTTSV